MDFDKLNAVELDRHATLVEREVSSWRGENGDEVRRWLEKFWRSRREETRREALRRAREAWLCP